jgi:hypothetical protein
VWKTSKPAVQKAETVKQIVILATALFLQNQIVLIPRGSQQNSLIAASGHATLLCDPGADGSPSQN